MLVTIMVGEDIIIITHILTTDMVLVGGIIITVIMEDTMETTMAITKGLEMEFMLLMEDTEIIIQDITEKEEVEELVQEHLLLMETEEQILEQVILQDMLKIPAHLREESQ